MANFIEAYKIQNNECIQCLAEMKQERNKVVYCYKYIDTRIE